MSHQVSVEALEAFYSRFPFHLCTRAAVVERLLGSLTARAKSLIREVIVNFAIYLRESPCGIEYDWRAGVERMMELLPNLRQVHLILHFRGYGLLRKHQESIVVERSVRIAGALKAFPALSVWKCRRCSLVSPQEDRILATIRENLVPSLRREGICQSMP